MFRQKISVYSVVDTQDKIDRLFRLVDLEEAKMMTLDTYKGVLFVETDFYPPKKKVKDFKNLVRSGDMYLSKKEMKKAL